MDKDKFPKSSPTYHEKAFNMAETNPSTALVYAVLAVANAITEHGSSLDEIAKQHGRLGVEMGGVAAALHGLGDEIAHFSPTAAE
jgi:hypothetical protein